MFANVPQTIHSCIETLIINKIYATLVINKRILSDFFNSFFLDQHDYQPWKSGYPYFCVSSQSY